MADRLLKGREYRRLAQAGVARELRKVGWKVSHTSVGEYERSDAQPPIAYGAAFCKALAIRPEWLLWGEGPMEARPHDLAALFFALVTEVVTSPLDEEELKHRLLVGVDMLRLEGPGVPASTRDPVSRPD